MELWMPWVPCRWLDSRVPPQPGIHLRMVYLSLSQQWVSSTTTDGIGKTWETIVNSSCTLRIIVANV